MKIPQGFPQFKERKSLIIASGEFEALFFKAENGEMNKANKISFDPREDAKEKQGFISRSPGASSLGAVSHKDRYMEDLKDKFLRKLSEDIESIIRNDRIKEIFLFSPKYVEKKIVEKILTKNKNTPIKTFSGEYTKEPEIKLLEMIKKQHEKLLNTSHLHRTEEERKIMHKLNNTQ